MKTIKQNRYKKPNNNGINNEKKYYCGLYAVRKTNTKVNMTASSLKKLKTSTFFLYQEFLFFLGLGIDARYIYGIWKYEAG